MPHQHHDALEPHTHGPFSLGHERKANSNEDHNDEEEKEYYQNVCKSFRQYATFMRCNRYNHSWRISSIPESQKAVLPKELLFGTEEWKKREDVFQKAELANQFFLDCMLKYHDEITSQEHRKLELAQKNETNTKFTQDWSTDENISKVQSVLKSLARDWSSEMAAERDQCYSLLIQAATNYLPVSKLCRSAPTVTEETLRQNVVTPPPLPRICVPGAGVGRLTLELVSKGYEVQGNEFSFHMLLASDFVLNACSVDRPFRIAPWLGPTRNMVSSFDTTRLVSIPDIDPASIISGDVDDQQTDEMSPNQHYNQPEFSMAAGDFVCVYTKESEREQWDGVVTCFFLDTAPSIVEYLQVIWKMLKFGGFLFNLGPLLYHWSAPPARPEDKSYGDYQRRTSHLDTRYIESIDLSWEEVRQVLISIGFIIVEERQGVQATYTADHQCMMNSQFQCIFFVAQKINHP